MKWPKVHDGYIDGMRTVMAFSRHRPPRTLRKRRIVEEKRKKKKKITNARCEPANPFSGRSNTKSISILKILRMLLIPHPITSNRCASLARVELHS